MANPDRPVVKAAKAAFRLAVPAAAAFFAVRWAAAPAVPVPPVIAPAPATIEAPTADPDPRADPDPFRTAAMPDWSEAWEETGDHARAYEAYRRSYLNAKSKATTR